MFRELAVARAGWEAARVDPASNRFIWREQVFRVDRGRGFIVLCLRDPDAPFLELEEDDFDIYAGECQLEDIGELSRVWASILGGFKSCSVWQIALAKFFNLAVVQPRVNPAFGPLFWLFLADDSGPGPNWDWSSNLFDRVGPMIYRLSEYPTLVPSPAEVRQAQIDFLETAWPGSTNAANLSQSDADWAAHCEALLVQNQKLVDDRFFDRILERIDSETGGSFD